LFTLGSFLTIGPKFGLLLTKNYVLILTEQNGLGCIFGDFFSQTHRVTLTSASAIEQEHAKAVAPLIIMLIFRPIR
jgi:hypothetical protein